MQKLMKENRTIVIKIKKYRESKVEKVLLKTHLPSFLLSNLLVWRFFFAVSKENHSCPHLSSIQDRTNKIWQNLSRKYFLPFTFLKKCSALKLVWQKWRTFLEPSDLSSTAFFEWMINVSYKKNSLFLIWVISGLLDLF